VLSGDTEITKKTMWGWIPVLTTKMVEKVTGVKDVKVKFKESKAWK
jgi:hypothetical protein